jgi:hypothetical protein
MIPTSRRNPVRRPLPGCVFKSVREPESDRKQFHDDSGISGKETKPRGRALLKGSARKGTGSEEGRNSRKGRPTRVPAKIPGQIQPNGTDTLKEIEPEWKQFHKGEISQRVELPGRRIIQIGPGFYGEVDTGREAIP